MVVSDTTRARSRRDKAPITDVLAAHEVQDALKSSRASSHSIGQSLPEREAYIAMDAPKNFMTTMTNTILQTMEAANSTRPLPTFDYLLTTGYEPSYRHAPIWSLHWSDERGADGLGKGTTTAQWGADARRARQAAPGRLATMRMRLRRTQLTPGGRPGLKNKRKPQEPQPTNTALKQYNPQKYYEFHKQQGYITAECKELKNTLYELADKGQLDRFLRRGP
ncbi:hypothetical protein Cgig2_009222 [Carnegiea gigantea]|uniref:Uncharacterized protein n=1 Tax=Carnegiea gigantea TaxID=171969 RepID=A0A9Q1QES4_9CARY|nr:hypothetical protein Cgig2_009222 [Carnegiea gigantea]